MAIHYLNSIDLNKNELQHAVIENQGSDALAGIGADGQLYFNTEDQVLKIWKNGGWKPVDDFTIGLSFNTSNGILTATVQNELDVTVDLDGRYALTSDIPTVNDATLTVQGTGVLGGSGTFTANDADNVTISISHDNTSRTDTTSTDAPGYGGTFEAVTGVTTNAQGHVTAIDVSTVTIPASDNTNTTYELNVAANGSNGADIQLVPNSGDTTKVTIDGTANEIQVTETTGIDGNIIIGLPDNVIIGNNLTVNGDLQVTGTVTTNNVETVSTSNGVIFEGNVADENELTLLAGTLTADRTVTLPNATGTIALTSDLSNATITVTAGDALTGGGTFTLNGSATEITIDHENTSDQASVNNSGRTYIQDVTLDEYGHVTGLVSATETVVDTNTQLSTAAALIDVSAMGSNTTASFLHNLDSKNLIVQLYDVTTGEVVFADIDHDDTNNISIIFASTPPNDIRVVIIDAKNGLADKVVTYS